VRKIAKWFIPLVLLFPLIAVAAPDLVLKDFNGRNRNVSEFIGQGKWTVVVIWAHNCPICNNEIHHMTFFHDAHKDKDAIVLGVTVDGWDKRKKARDFVKTHELDFTNLIAEPRQDVMVKFGGGEFYGTPTYYVYSPKGELLARQIGPVTQETIEKFIDSVNQAKSKKTDTSG
jgi:peroxiredoxin